jgi:hypothetical protein
MKLRAMVGLSPVHAPNMVFYDAMAMRGEGDPSTFTERNPFSAVGRPALLVCRPRTTRCFDFGPGVNDVLPKQSDHRRVVLVVLV